jgi:hypothetical protein
MLMLVGMGNPLGTRNPHGYGVGQNLTPVMGMSFLAGVFFLRGYEFGQVIPSGFLPIAISMCGQAGSCGCGGVCWAAPRGCGFQLRNRFLFSFSVLNFFPNSNLIVSSKYKLNAQTIVPA